MTTQVFTWYPDKGSSMKEEPKVSLTKMGDGYEIRASIGINNSPQMWDLSFTSVSPDFVNILAFVRARKGVEAFQWTSPLSETNMYVCRKWNGKLNAELRSMTLTFEQVFEPAV